MLSSNPNVSFVAYKFMALLYLLNLYLLISTVNTFFKYTSSYCPQYPDRDRTYKLKKMTLYLRRYRDNQGSDGSSSTLNSANSAAMCLGGQIYSIKRQSYKLENFMTEVCPIP